MRRAELVKVAGAAYGRAGEWAYEAFDVVNARYFDGRLPTPWIQWAITPHSSCLASTRPRAESLPVVTLHPSLLGSDVTEDPWGIKSKYLGPAYAFDVLLHECIHIQVVRVRKYVQARGETSHNNAAWIEEVNRIAPLLGFDGMKASRSKLKRRGEIVRREVEEGSVPFSAAYTFPQGYREIARDMAYYSRPNRQSGIPTL